MPLDTTAITHQLKQVYSDHDIQDLFASHTLTYNQFDKSDRKAKIRPAGVGYYFATRQANIESAGARAEGGMLPEPLTGDGVQGIIVPKLLYSVIRMSGLAIEAGKGDTAAFVDTQSDAVMQAYRALTVDMNRQCHGDGFGALATLSAASESLSTTTTWTFTCDNDVGVRYLKKGMVVDFYDGAAIDQSSVASRISSIDPVTRIVTMEDHGTTAGAGSGTYQAYHPIVAARTYTIVEQAVPTAAVVVRYGARLAAFNTGDTPYEMVGLEGMYDDDTLLGTFEGIDTGNDPEFQATVMRNASVDRELSIDLMLSAMNMTAAKSAGATVDLMRMGMGQVRKYYGLLAPDKRFTSNSLKGGYETLSFSQNAAVEMLVDPVCQPGRIYFEPKTAIKKYELTPVGWGGFDANNMHWRENYDEATMFLKTYTNLGVENRPALTLLKDLKEPANSPF